MDAVTLRMAQAAPAADVKGSGSGTPTGGGSSSGGGGGFLGGVFDNLPSVLPSIPAVVLPGGVLGAVFGGGEESEADKAARELKEAEAEAVRLRELTKRLEQASEDAKKLLSEHQASRSTRQEAYEAALEALARMRRRGWKRWWQCASSRRGTTSSSCVTRPSGAPPTCWMLRPRPRNARSPLGSWRWRR